MPFTTETARTLGARGGGATVERHGRPHMQAIGRRGFRATVHVIERPGAGAIAYDRYTWLVSVQATDEGLGVVSRDARHRLQPPYDRDAAASGA